MIFSFFKDPSNGLGWVMIIALFFYVAAICMFTIQAFLQDLVGIIKDKFKTESFDHSEDPHSEEQKSLAREEEEEDEAPNTSRKGTEEAGKLEEEQKETLDFES